MSNEKLGIYEELRARAEDYGEFAEKIKRRLVYPPISAATPTFTNPFLGQLRRRIKIIGKPANQRYRRIVRPVWPEARYGLPLYTVIKTVIDESELTPGDVFSTWQTWRVARPRQVIWHMIDRYCPDYTLPQIAFLFGKDHTTILHGIEKVHGRLAAKDPDTVDLVERSRLQLQLLAAA